MRLFDRQRDEAGSEQAQRPERDGARLEELRLAGEELLAAGADAIDRTLSGDSEAFLASTKQEGGQ